MNTSSMSKAKSDLITLHGMLPFMVDLAIAKFPSLKEYMSRSTGTRGIANNMAEAQGLLHALIYIQLMAFITQILMIFVYKILCQNVSVIKEMKKIEGVCQLHYLHHIALNSSGQLKKI